MKFFLLLSFSFFAHASTVNAAKPNIVILLADDAGWGDFSHSGNQLVATPQIDSIAKAGVSLDRFFVCPVCSPTRAEMLTGRYHPRGGVTGVSTGQERLNLDEATLPEAFKAAGYATGCFGKWHNGSQWPYHPLARGFGQYFGYTSGHWGEYFDAPLEDNGRMVRTSGYIVNVCTDKALAFIEQHRAEPFLCYVPFTTPHSPWAAPEQDWARWKDRKLTQTATLADKENADETRCALAMLENQDANVGRILAKLDELKLADNTIVLYFSDNGPNGNRWTGGMKGKKGTTDEAGVRSVCFLRWPGQLPSGHQVSQICGAIDLLPTLTSLAGITRVGDKPLDGRDLTPLLRKQKTDWQPRNIFTTWAGGVSVRTQTHRLDAAGNLFDMLVDPGQTKPINDTQPAMAAELNGAVKSWRAEMKLGAGKGNAVDPRPIPVGYREFPITMLPARDGEPHGGIKRSANAPNCSYFVNWKSKEDRMTWLLDVHTSGKYAVEIDYTCPIADAGSLIALSLQTAELTGKVTPGWDPPIYTNQDTIPRHGESQMKDFHTLKLGEINLAKGQGTLTLQAKEITGQSVMDVRRVTLTLMP
jgi:arylsulfatase A-like enzyme